MTSSSKLYFINHASFAIERDSEILLIDPWYEGTAFNNGWALLDQSTSNELVVGWLRKTNKKIYIWYSHEHSDHLSMSFLKLIKKENFDLKIIFQKTIDRRVFSFLNNQQFNVLEAEEGRSIEIGKNFSITTWPYWGGDSYCLITIDGKSLLNINDCVISNKNEAAYVKKKIGKISVNIEILLTQFGYANWSGNEDDIEQRVKLANHKFDRIFIQNSVLTPSVIIPFASFVFFCHPENFYLNDAQNSPENVKAAKQLESIQEKIFFMKPWDFITLDDTKKIKHQLSQLTGMAVKHWVKLKNTIHPISHKINQIETHQLENVFLTYRKHVSLNFIFFPQFLEIVNFIKPIKIFITDTNRVVSLSYLTGFSFQENSKEWHISISSEVFNFIFKNDYGFNTTIVNGRFRLERSGSIIDVSRFFSPQEYTKNGFGIKHPFISGIHLINKITRLILTRLTKLTQPQI
jgi:UDP-MurNAc hydroxylase